MDIPPDMVFAFIYNHIWVSIIAILLGLVSYHGRWRRLRRLPPEHPEAIDGVAFDFVVEAVIVPHAMAFIAILIGSIGNVADNTKLLFVIVATLRPRELMDAVVAPITTLMKNIVNLTTPGGKDDDDKDKK